MIKTYSLSEVAQALCGDSMARPERWLTRQIAVGRFTARRVGRHWRMTQDDLDHALAVMANRTTPATTAPALPADPVSEMGIGSPSTASRRRRLAVAR